MLLGPGGLPVKLPAVLSNDGEPSIVLSPDGGTAAVVFEDSGCNCDTGREDGTVRHRVLKVALATGAAVKVCDGPGTAAAAFDSNGDLWVQEDRKLARASDLEPAPLHVLLSPGHVGKTYCCGL